MTRSDRFLDAVRAFEDWRLAQKAKPPDLFTVATAEPDAWKDDALAALLRAAHQHAELTVECIAWPPAVDNRARGWAMQEAARRRWVKPLGWVSGNTGRHGRPVRLWASVVYGGGPDAA